ncbi:MAG: hypothetical protein KIS64_09660 [Fimbriimonadaceae bacterium]|nr:hypothetical protein [Fimbriimonadaceae bacterium]
MRKDQKLVAAIEAGGGVTLDDGRTVFTVAELPDDPAPTVAELPDDPAPTVAELPDDPAPTVAELPDDPAPTVAGTPNRRAGRR